MGTTANAPTVAGNNPGSDEADKAWRERHSAWEPTGETVPPWLLRHRVTVPGRGVNYVDRPDLATRCTPTDHGLTLLMAPGGFGKTTLMAECCRRLIDDGVATAWLSLGEQDDPATLDTYLAYAFQLAGLDVLEPLGGGGRLDGLQRTGLLMHAVEMHGSPCVLALDELERLTNPDAVAIINLLVRSSPPDLHLAIACRELPRGLDLAGRALEGDVEILTSDDLRFSKPDVARFFDLKLSRSELAAVVADSAGWPIALHIRRNEGASGLSGEERVLRDVVDSWLESRLWYSFAEADVDFLLDIGLFEWMDAELLDEVFGETGVMQRIERMSGLAGLVEPVREGAMRVHRLHSLVRYHCATRRRRETPDRYRSIHGRIARALERRGETVLAVQHAAEAMDPTLIGEILMNAGILRLWLTEGVDRLIAIDGYLSDEIFTTYPILEMMRCVALSYTGRLTEARKALETAVGRLETTGQQTGLDHQVNRCLAHAMLCHNGCESVGSSEFETAQEECARLADMPEADRTMCATMELGLCIVHHLKAEFDKAMAWGTRARRKVGGTAPYVTMGIEFQFGQISMAQGRTREAAAWYERGLKVANAGFLRDPRLTVLGEVLLSELNLERNRVGDASKAVRVTREFRQTGAQYVFFAAACDVAVDLALRERGVEPALSIVEDIWEHARRVGLPALARHSAALRTNILAIAGRVTEAERAWRVGVLPDTDRGCLDISGQSWREMEILSCARLRLLIARENFEAARRFVRNLLKIGEKRGLRRTLMRGQVLAMRLEDLAGNRKAALNHLDVFLRRFVETDFARPLVREGELAVALLEDHLEVNADSQYREPAKALLSASRVGKDAIVPQLTSREREVLLRLENQRDKEIATALAITPHGVRYHLRKIFDKLNATGRLDAIRRARAVGLLPNGE